MSWQPSTLAKLSLLALVLGVACLQGARAPKVTPEQVLAPRAAALEAPVEEGPFAVVAGSPQGVVSAASEITIVFNRPMRALDLAGEEVAPPVTMSPEVEGSFRWVGTNALHFVPEGQLPSATEYRVEVPKGTRALDGSTLPEAYVLTFSTARPALVDVEPGGYRPLSPSSTFTLRFNQGIADRAIQSAVSLVVQGRAFPFDIRRPDPKNQKLAVLVPKRSLPKNTEITLRVSEDLRGVAGPLPAGEGQEFSFRTYGPLEVLEVHCDTDTPHGGCAPRGGVSVQLNNPVKFGALRRAISIDPPLPLRFHDYADDELVEYLWFRAPFAAKTSYRVEIRANLEGGGKLKDDYGQALARPFTKEISTDDYWPEVEIGVAGSYLEPSRAQLIPVGSVNTRYELLTSKLDEEQVLAFFSDHDGRVSAVSRLAKLTSAKPRAIQRSVPDNEKQVELVDAAKVLGGSTKRGPFVVATSYLSRPGTREEWLASEYRLLQLTDLGISAKLSREGSLVWVTSLSTAQPIAQAEVEIRTKKESFGTFLTDRDGLAIIPKERFRPDIGGRDDAIIFVRKGNDWAFREASNYLNSYQFGVASDYNREEAALGMLFTERGLYRPGDTVKLKGIVRQPEAQGTLTPAGRKLKLAVSGPEGDEVSSHEATLNAFGTFHLDLTIPTTAKLGSYQMTATLAGSERRWGDFHGSFEVAEYRPAEFKVAVESQAPFYIRQGRASFEGRADFLFGAPMSHAEASYRVTRDKAWYAVPDLPPGFVTSDDAFLADRKETAAASHLLESGEAKLDEKGELRLSAGLSLPGQTGPERVSCEIEVTDVARQTLSGRASAIVHPGEFYLALRKEKTGFSEAGEAVKVEALAVSPEGARQEKARVTIELLRRTWELARKATGGASFHSEVNAVDTLVGSCGVTTGREAVSCSLTPEKGGYYVIRATSKDAKGNPIAASMGLYVMGPGQGGWGDNDQLRVDLVSDKASYQMGDKARILVKSPFKEADALVTVERAGIQSQERVTLRGETPTLEIPITEAMRPNAFVSVVLLQGRGKEAPKSPKQPDVGAPSFRVGYAELIVDPASRRFQVTVAPKKGELAPGDTVEVDVNVRDAEGAGRQAEVTLYAVDEGVLSLIGYKTPDPLPVFTAPRPLRVFGIESREDMARVRSRESLILGLEKGDEGGGGGNVRRDFRQTVYFNPSLVTDDAGRAKASFKLPDNLTTYRVMAVAVGKGDRFGFGEANVTASKKLMARPALPRFLRAGDRIDAGVVVSSKGLAKAAITIEASAEGLVLEEAAKKTITLSENASEEVRFRFQAPKATEATIRFRVQGGGAADAVEIRRSIEAPTSIEAVALYGETSTASGEALGDLASLRSDVGGLEISLSSTNLVGLGAGMEQLIDYPYGCIEQQTSRLVPLVALRDLARDYGIALPSDADARVSSTVAKILAAQRGDGGFGFWPDSPSSNPWVTAYALFGLAEAKRHGVSIPPRAIEDAVTYLRRSLEGWEEKGLGPATAAFVVDALAMSGSPDPAWENRLYESRDKLPLFGRALLAHAMTVSKASPQAIAELKQNLVNHVRLEGPIARAVANVGDEYAPLLDSQARTTALVLRALLAISPNDPLAGRLAKGLLADREGGTWRSTQETAWALLALDAYAKAQERAQPAFDARVFLGQGEIFSAAFRGRQDVGARTSLPASKLVAMGGETLAFQVEGQGKLYYEARLRYAKKELPTAPLDRGFFVKQTLRAVRPEELSEAIRLVPKQTASSFQGGALVLADVVVVTTSPREQVVIEAPLPAGFEPVDAKLTTTASYLDVPATGGEDGAIGYGYGDAARDSLASGDDAYLSSFVRKEMRDDRVLFFVEHMKAGMFHYRYLARATTMGSFIVPPVNAKAMYAPEVFGRAASTTVDVRP